MALIKCPECSKEVSESAPTCPSCGMPISSESAEPQFKAFRKRVLTRGRIFSFIGLGIGLYLELPYVWGLGIVGIIVSSLKLTAMKK